MLTSWLQLISNRPNLDILNDLVDFQHQESEITILDVDVAERMQNSVRCVPGLNILFEDFATTLVYGNIKLRDVANKTYRYDWSSRTILRGRIL